MSRHPQKHGKSDSDRRVRQADRLARVLKVLQLIQGHGRWNVRALSRELECAERTVHRYLEVLLYAGVPFWFDREQGCYRVRPGLAFPVLNLTEDELLGQAVATAATSAAGLDVTKGAGPTTQKIAAVSGQQASRLLDQAAELVRVLDLKLVDHRRHHEAIRLIQQALLYGKRISGRYASPYALEARRVELHPFRLCFVRQAWYLIAQPIREDHPKTYRVARFQGLRMLNTDAVVPVDFDLGAYFGNAWSAFRGNKSYDVEILFSKEAATQVTETVWHRTQRVERHADGSVTLRFTVDGLHEILWWLLSWTGFAEVIRPLELREALVEQLQFGLKLNG